MWGSIVSEWASLILRWLHVVAAIAWIGSSFYFIALDLSLKPDKSLPDGVQGEAWQVHGGGFYRIMKYLVAPSQMPEELTWFKWEAYTTWLSGFALMVVVYYLEADLFLVDKSILDLTPLQAGLFSFGSLALAWLLYEVACRTGLAQRELPFAIGGYIFLVVLTYAFTHVLSGR
ncbi:MAG: urate hydroxylase PuuD, partial [Bradyrhizobium guangdongense]